jgi:diguanylate cyclase (GGDEF)-like protein
MGNAALARLPGAQGGRKPVATAAGSLAPKPVPQVDPRRLLHPAAELATAALALCTAAVSGMAAGLLPPAQTVPASLALPLALGSLGLIGLQGALAAWRWRRGLEALTMVERQATSRAITDPLTGLANRSGYKLGVDAGLAQRRPEQPVGVVYIDLDRFKEVNDNYGHEMGDKLLCAVTGRLAEISQGRAIGARLGGDEFALMVDGCRTAAEIVTMGETISQRLGQPFTIDGIELVIGGSVGVAIAPEDGVEPSELLRRADIAMYRAKGAGRGTCFRFHPSMEDGVRQKRVMEDALRHAIGNDELEMVYQPFFASDGETIRGVEALVRWNSPKLGRVSPGDFIPLAEETGLIGEIGEWTVRRALEDAARWPDISIAVNVSPAQFRGKDLAQRLIAIIDRSGIEPKRVEIEVTEGVLIRDADKAQQTITQLRDHGMRVALDDFGTGFASLSYLRRFRFDKLKIDQVFVRSLGSERGSGSAAIIHNVVALGRSLGLTVQAEGVETLEHHIFLRAAGCHCLQGYYFAKPLSRDEFDAFFKARRGLGNDYERRFGS